MSAFMVEKHHIGYLVAAAFAPGFRAATYIKSMLGDPEKPEHALANLLSLENARSITYRYPQDAMDDVMHTWERGEVESMCWAAMNPAQVIQSVRCYQYQACEHPGWKDSKAKEITDNILMAAVRSLPAVEKADWGAPEPMSRNARRIV
ncbi:MAG: hypothetical protein IPP14_15770 [Planctomycetes bacterium]|nr:hypothetical protein [Planctomycetota bacterium]